MRRAYNLRVPRTAPSGELTFAEAARAARPARRSRPGNVPAGRRDRLASLHQSRSTDARERQWRHFYYGQDTWRVTPKLTIDYGLRLDIINPQTINEPGNAGFLDLETGEIRVAGVGDTNSTATSRTASTSRRVWASPTRATDKLVFRVGYGRSYDIGVFGSIFGHSVTQNLPVLAVQNLNAAEPTSTGSFTLAQGPHCRPSSGSMHHLIGRRAEHVAPSDGVLPAERRLRSRACRRSSGCPRWTPTTSPCSISSTRHHLGRGRPTSATRARTSSPAAAPTSTSTRRRSIRISERPATIPRDLRRTYFQRFGWTQDIDFFCNCADNRYDSLQTKFTRRFNNSFSINANYTLARSLQNDGNQFFYNRELTRGAAEWDRRHTFIFTNVADIPVGRGRRSLTDAPKAVDAILGGFQFNSATRIASGRPFGIGFNRGDTYSGQSGAVDVCPHYPNLVRTPELGEFRRNGEISSLTIRASVSRVAPSAFRLSAATVI